MSRQFNNRLVQWIDRRLPIFSTLCHEAYDYPTPRNLNYFWNFGSLAGFVLAIMVLSGLFLAMNYVPSTHLAFDSVERIMRDVNYGWLLRYTHANGASMFFIIVYVHICRSLYYGSYKAPRELLWWTGLAILLTMMATAFMGYVLPWGQMSLWGATVITTMFSAIPIVGESVVTWLWGGFSVDNPTLNRFFALHFLLPMILFGLAAVHVWALHAVRSNNPLGVEIKGPQDSISFHPYYTIKDLFGIGVFMIFFMIVVFWFPNWLGHPDNYILANPMVTPQHIVPEWYFLPFYAILRSVPDKLGGVVLMFAAILILAFLPWLDSSKVRSCTFRPVYRWFVWLLVADVLLLGYAGSKPADQELYIVLGRVATFWYFFHFLVLTPLTARLEKPLPVPESIASSVLLSASSQETSPRRHPDDRA